MMGNFDVIIGKTWTIYVNMIQVPVAYFWKETF